MNESFHERLKRLREAKGWDVSHLGTRSRLLETTITALENDPGQTPAWIAISKLARALGTNPYYLASGDGSDKPYQVPHRGLPDVGASFR